MGRDPSMRLASCSFPADLGSYFGLLMGCSVLTMFEVIDLFVYHSIVKIIERVRRKPKHSYRDIVNIPMTDIIRTSDDIPDVCVKVEEVCSRNGLEMSRSQL